MTRRARLAAALFAVAVASAAAGFLTVDAAGNAAYPYIIGSQYYGVVDTGNLGAGSITVPADVTFYVAPEPGAVGVMAVGAVVMLRRRRSLL
ncbi:MAG TPA: PEP-CTERM sorting domain-containing protein [Tepidisphaeraceae bacterium]|nr:PEP-CTERM sorting domain-containing protein [Tepidisphaeraceae bacterium]